MRTFAVSSVVHATPERVWSILTNASRYPEWNSTVTGIEGRIAAGERIVMRVVLSPGRAFPLTVATFDPPEDGVARRHAARPVRG